GLRDIVKQNTWWNYCIEENFDVVLLTETKTTKEMEKFIFFEQNQTSNLQDPLYNIWWSSTTEAYNNNIGSGFKGRVVFQIIRIYAPNKYSSNNTILRKLKPWFYNHIAQALSNNWISIIMGDWNATTDPSKDRFPEYTFYQIFKEEIRSKSCIDSIWIHKSHEELIIDAVTGGFWFSQEPPIGVT
ncbi:11531_t:CDS:2, partial [Dentiscutata erythropus]